MFGYLLLLFALETVARKATIIGRDSSLRDCYDFVIIGGGTSGLTVADRLTEDPHTTVLVIEYGPLDKHEPSVLVPGLLNLTSTPYWFDLTSTPQEGLDRHTFPVPAAAVVGGASVINGLFFDRGSVADYHAWGLLGNSGWSWKDMLYYFKKSETFTPPANDFADAFDISWENSTHGFDGPIQSSFPTFQFPCIKNFFRGWHSLGVPTPKDAGNGEAGGVFWAPSSLDPKDETRSYSRTAHYDRVIGSRPNYHLLTESAVSKILLDDNRAVGVEYIYRASNCSEKHAVKASKEVILAAGAIHSPQILQLSGIGDEKLLRRFGIDTKVHLPGVGRNFQDHPTLYPVFNFQAQLTPNIGELTYNQTYATQQLDLYFSQHQGPYTIANNGGNTVTFLPLPNITSTYRSIIAGARSEPLSSYGHGLDRTVLAGYLAQRNIILKMYATTTSSVQETGWNGNPVMPITLVKPLSRGSITIKSDSILDAPLIDYRALTISSDLEILIAALRRNREFLATPAMQELAPQEISPGAHLTSDEDLRKALRNLVVPTYSHACCTTPMMRKRLGGVVDSDLRVHGVCGLRVVDAGIMPLIPGTHLSAAVYAIAEYAADLIKEAWREG